MYILLYEGIVMVSDPQIIGKNICVAFSSGRTCKIWTKNWSHNHFWLLSWICYNKQEQNPSCAIINHI